MKTELPSIIPSTYAPLLADLKARVRAAQVKAAVSVNRELIVQQLAVQLGATAVEGEIVQQVVRQLGNR